MKLPTIIKFGLIFFLGGIAGFLSCEWTYFEFDNKIVLVDLINLVLTGGLGYYIATALQNKIGSNRVEKDLLIEEIKKIKTELEKVQAYVDNGSIPFNEVLALLKSTSSNISSLILLIKLCKIQTDCGFPEIQRKTSQVKRLITNSPSISGSFVLSQSSKTSTLYLLKDLNNQLFKAIVSVNRHDHN